MQEKNESKAGEKVRDGPVRPDRLKTRHRGRDAGMLSVEISIILPLILFIVAGIILLFVAQGRREVLRASLYEAVYTLPVSEELMGDPNGELQSRRNRLMDTSGAEELAGLRQGDDIYMMGTVRYSGIGSYSAVLAAVACRERDLCTKRLRRWQVYQEIVEE